MVMKDYQKKYDIIVVGAGHAGCEAALAAANMGCTTLLATIDMDKIAAMPCSPSIGGMAKGQLVKEIDALGGVMAKISDASAIQYHTLNRSKGPAVHSTRTQNDKIQYQQKMKSVIESNKNLDLKQIMVENLVIEDGKVKGITEKSGFGFSSQTVILATGTFLKGVVHIGSTCIEAGRAGEFASIGLAASLEKAGFTLGRMKTGTPPRLHRASIDFSLFFRQESDPDPAPFSFSTKEIVSPMLPSYIGHTNENSHGLVKKNLKHSALYGGQIKGRAARYCPSFEDKVVKFPDRKIHQIILEHEGVHTEEIYASGLGNSLPFELQLEFVHSVKGLEEAEIMRPAYAIEYDYINPQQLNATLETKTIEGLFFAGQINGTSGYEEAAAQGMWAGINAACRIQNRESFVLDRSEAYMGVMVDDLVTRGINEPYRMFTSRAEYRLMLREDNADLRLAQKGHMLGLVDKESLAGTLEIKKATRQEINRIKKSIIKPSSSVNNWLKSKHSNQISTGIKLDQLLKRAGMDYSAVETLAPAPPNIEKRVKKQVEIEIKYEGYISRQLNEIKKFKNMEKIKIPDKLDFSKIHGLSNELKEKLIKISPESLGQASRMEGMTPAAISVLMVAITTFSKKQK
ncbi:MAG: tRNA uridine-5-carboxymethylaminomethyl(34) synthesis enzyme MnmG [Thermodesulfobacteriota bacterium]|nr:tRNA uridine-5-carboxymethylaminomethyl(34) synthesis enzyme MnmG [Thermodesulfobacteriota bacterium]